MTWIKICGLSTRETVNAAVTAGADAVGFVFADSKRRVTPEHAAEISHDVPKNVLKVAVLHHPAQALVDEVCSMFQPDVLQTDAADLDTLRIPRGMSVLPVWRDGQSPSVLPSRMLYEGKVSGTGTTADWRAAHALALKTQLVLAGGLDARNVAEALTLVQPFGVDVSSGVESAPGVKDPRKIEEFIRAVRTQ
jgi:phosphoribosylanthranilate isomerase